MKEGLGKWRIRTNSERRIMQRNQRIHKILPIILCILWALLLTGCAGQTKPTELVIGAAASLQPALEELQSSYEKENPKIKLTFNFAGSGTLQQQIEEGAPMDVFFSAAVKQMDALEGEGYLLQDSKTELLKNEIVLVLPKDSQLKLSSFEDITKTSVIAIGNPDSVPAGQYAKEIFDSLGIWDEVSAKATLGKDVTEVLAWVGSGEAETGVVYATDAKNSDAVTIAATAPIGSHSDIIYPVSVLKATKQETAARDYIQYLSSEEAKKVFEKYGFLTLE